MLTVQHPTFPAVTRQVTDDELPAWEEQGWVPVVPAEFSIPEEDE